MRRLLSLATAVAILVGALAVPSPVGAFSTTGACPNLRSSWAMLDLGAGYWATGTHTYAIRYVDTLHPEYGGDFGPWTFTVSTDAPLYPGNVMMPNLDYLTGFGSLDGRIYDLTINPAQGTVMRAGWVWDMTGQASPGDTPTTMAQAKAELAVAAIYYSWDDGPWVLARQGPLTDDCVGGFEGWFHRTWGQKF